MVKEVKFEGKKTYICEECGFHYLDRETAERCQNWCSIHNQCSTEITKSSVERTVKI